MPQLLVGPRYPFQSKSGAKRLKLGPLRIPCAEQMRSGRQGQLAAPTVGVSATPSRVTSAVYHLSTLRHFDNKVHDQAKTDPLIPCERRLRKTEISEFQEVTFESGFGYRDYDRPFTTFLVILSGFD